MATEEQARSLTEKKKPASKSGSAAIPEGWLVREGPPLTLYPKPKFGILFAAGNGIEISNDLEISVRLGYKGTVVLRAAGVVVEPQDGPIGWKLVN